MTISRILAITYAITLVPALKADEPISEVPWVTTSKRGHYFFKMVPPKWKEEGGNLVIEREPFGVAYKVSTEGEFREIWRTQGWYAFEGYLSDDGRYFVRFGPWAKDQREHSDLALAFYDGGKLIKQYEVRELIKQPDLLENSVSHYSWVPQIQSEPNGFKGESFHLVMIDKTTFTFDVATGGIMETGRDEAAKSNRELFEEEQAESARKGMDLFAASDFRKIFEEQFNFSQIEAGYKFNLGAPFKDTEWRATLKPIKSYSQPCMVRVFLPIHKDKKIEMLIEPKEIDRALETALSHPFVMKQFEEGGAKELSLHITSDRLHSDSLALMNLLAKISKGEPTDGELRNWVDLNIDARDHRYTSIYLNMKTKALIYEDESGKWPYEPIRLDSAGKRTDANKTVEADGKKPSK